MRTENELNMILQTMVNAYRSIYGEHIVKLVLYGSYARGDYKEDWMRKNRIIRWMSPGRGLAELVFLPLLSMGKEVLK